MGIEAVKAAYADHVMLTYRRAEVAFERGSGCHLFDTEGNQWLDCLAGIAVCGLGHAHPAIVAAVSEQATRLMHTSNLYYIPPQAEVARELTALSGMDRAFFCNSGAEAIEACLKIARKWGKLERGGASGIVAALDSFHGRTMGAISATGQEKYRRPFEPMVPGFTHVPYGRVELLADAVGPETVAVVLEPIQGESGVRIPPDGYLREVRQICDERGILLILDEIQTGLGRTGIWFEHQREGIVPDLMALAKTLGGGFPMGACLAREPYGSVLEPGDHASTFGGNYLACAASLAFLSTMKQERLVDHAARMGAHAMASLRRLADLYPRRIREVRGRGLMIGIELSDGSAQALNAQLFARRVLANAVGDSVLRILPPLVITKQEIDQFVDALEQALDATG